MRVRYKVQGLAEIKRETEGLRRRLGLSAGEFADIAAKAVRDTVARNVQPFGMGKKALQKGTGAIRKDLRKVFEMVPEAARGRSGVITSMAAAERWHQSRRGSNGRTRRGKRRKIVASVYRMYAAKVIEQVGTAKGSVIGGEPPRLKGRFSPWVKRWKRKGSSRRKKSVFGAIWIFKAEPDHVASDRVLGERGVRRVMRSKDRVLRNVLKRRMRSELKKAERRVNR